MRLAIPACAALGNLLTVIDEASHLNAQNVEFASKMCFYQENYLRTAIMLGEVTPWWCQLRARSMMWQFNFQPSFYRSHHSHWKNDTR
ncbi:uncharacterized protein LAESUDRAFT_727940 [Laetiporus sulphureus 93-53]|uniref:Uncharacterized protein n=1 Tax=Laetiporus sulphureus 93-53 TaxID=1314785 RepID=A0A165DB43_9APHY|nr:uncharacterized protein LAESUDRAFT_727940 [Laetiporus sulphureus 93-53]KZT04468.1 hypothetical protein LAESUDRAFT_727940 [Laetiporus sulphureus 93-53]